MKQLKIILGYLLGLTLMLLIATLTICVISKTTFLKSNYIKKTLAKENYYQKVNDEIIINMKNYMTSSVLPDSILEGLFSLEQVKQDINNYIDNLYQGNKYKISTDIKTKLKANIEKYINNYDVTITSEESVKSFIEDINKIYEKEIILYNRLDNYISYLPKINNIVNIIFIISLICLFLNLLGLKKLRYNHINASIIACGLVLIFIRFVLLNKIDISYISIITDNFSEIIKAIIYEFLEKLTYFSIFYLILGLFFMVFAIFKQKRLEK